MRKVLQKFKGYLFARHSSNNLVYFRRSVAVVLIFQALAILPDFHNLYTDSGFLKSDLNSYITAQRVPFFDIWYLVITALNAHSTFFVDTLFALYSFSLVGLLAGRLIRTMAFISWATHFAIFYFQGNISAYGVDAFAHIALFYLIFVPSIKPSPIRRDSPNLEKNANYYRGPAIRMLQLHLAIAYCSSGILKGLGIQWRNGEVIWRSYMLPQFGKIDMTWLVSASILPMLISWSVLFLEAMYPLGMIWKRSRPFFLVGIIGMHLSIAFSMGLWSFSLMMVALNVSLFGADYIDSAVNVAKNFRLKGKSMFSSRLQIGLDQKQTKLG